MGPGMLKKWVVSSFLSAKIETAANIATIVVAGLLSVVLVKTYFIPASWLSKPLTPPAADVTGAGTHLSDQLPGVEWNKNGQTVVLALSTQCHFCTESAPFFRKLGEKAGKAVRIVSIMPQPVADAESYLRRNGVRVDEIRQVSLEKIGVPGTPTLLLVNGDGVVTKSWVGKLQPQQEGEVLGAISGGQSADFRSGSRAAVEANP